MAHSPPKPLRPLLACSALWISLSLPLASCGGGGESGGSGSSVASSSGGPAANSPMDQAKHFYKSACATCHAASGKGDSPAAKALDPQPRDYTSAEWQASVTDDHIRKVILKGGASVGLSPTMPGNAALEDKPEVLAAMVQLVRSFVG